MTPVSIKISDVTYVDFKKKQIIGKQILSFNKMELLHSGLIDFGRLIKHGKVELVSRNDGVIPHDRRRAKDLQTILITGTQEESA
jgi:hypothetical protein